MIPRIAFATALFLLAPGASGQTCAPASASRAAADDVVASFGVAERSETLLSSLVPAWDSLALGQAVADSVRSALLACADPGLLRDAAQYLASPAYARLRERIVAFSPAEVDPIGLTLGLHGGAIADSALALRYTHAAGDAALLGAIARDGFDAVVAAYPDDIGLPPGADPDSLGALFEAKMTENALQGIDAAALQGYADLDPADVAAAAAFYESPAGRYVLAARDAGTRAAVSPHVARAMVAGNAPEE